MTHATRHSRAFTLVEILVTVSVVAVLIAILLPALSRAKERSNAVVCGQNLKQLGTLAMMYFGEGISRGPAADDAPRIVLAHLPITPPPPPAPATPPGGAVTYAIGSFDSRCCPYADDNPAYLINPATESPKRSYGLREPNVPPGVTRPTAWLYADSVYLTVLQTSDLAGYRHNGKVNVFFKDAHVDLMDVAEVDFAVAK